MSNGTLPFSGEIILKAQGLEKRFTSGEKEITVLQGIDMEIRAGGVYSIRGESGSGKSTLLNLLSGIEKPDRGTVDWEGLSISELKESTLTKRRGSFIGFIFQAFYLLPELNVLENAALAGRIVGLSVKESKQRAADLLERLGLGDRGKSSVEHLSGGERQRVAIARAMINQPKILLADEPTGNLDEKTANSVIEMLLKLSREEGMAMVLVTHHPGFAGMAESRLYLRNGVMAPCD